MRKLYLVGGAVRDQVMGIEPKDYDWVVTGATPQMMLDDGFHQVGADFPVFLSSDGEEYALARTEKRVGAGYHGFETIHTPDVTLIQDLFRRDLTINSMALDGDTIIDPFDGQQDIRDKVLRATSDAFEEDPLRVLRVGRFHARFGEEWTIDQGYTQQAITSMVSDGRVREITPERIWKETERALMEDSPWLYLDFLCPVMGIDMTAGHRYAVVEMLKKAVKANLSAEARWVLFLIRLDVKTVRKLNDDLKVPTSFKRLYASMLFDYTVPKTTTGEDCLDNLLWLNDLHNGSHLPEVLGVLVCCLHHQDMHKVFWLWSSISQAAKSVKASTFLEQGFTGKGLGDKLREERIKLIEEIINDK